MKLIIKIGNNDLYLLKNVDSYEFIDKCLIIRFKSKSIKIINLNHEPNLDTIVIKIKIGG